MFSTSGTVPGPRRQAGAGLIGWLLVLVVVAFVAVMALRIVPVYMESMTVRSVVDEVASDPELRGAGVNDVRRAVNRRMQVNSVDSVARDGLSVERAGESVRVVVEYERRFPLVWNLDGVASFRNEAMVEP